MNIKITFDLFNFFIWFICKNWLWPSHLLLRRKEERMTHERQTSEMGYDGIKSEYVEVWCI